jgi:hypothetical protein
MQRVNASTPSGPRRPPTCDTRRWRRRAAVGLALALLAVSQRGAAEEEVAAPITAVWKEQTIYFSYGSSVVVYSCSALQNRVARILLAIGARPDLEVRVSNCSESLAVPDAPMNGGGTLGGFESPTSRSLTRRGEPRQLLNVRVRARMPVAVTPEILVEVEKDRSRRELVARVTGNPAARFDDLIEFTAQRQLVTLSPKTIGIEADDCELLDQISARGFRQLGVRVVSSRLACDPDRVSRLNPELQVEALIGTQFGFAVPHPKPAAAEKETTKETAAAPEEPAAGGEQTAEPATDAPSP